MPLLKHSFQYTHFGLLGVELFFMISGFVILLSAERAESAASFLLGRAARIYPAYIVSIIPALMSVVVVYGPSRQLVLQLAANLTMLQRFVNVGDLAAPYWTLAYELWFYVIVAVIMRLRLLPHIAAVCLIWLAIFLPVQAMNRAAILELPGRAHLLTLIDFGSFFIIGMMSYLVLTGRRSPLTVTCLLLAILFNTFGRQDWAEVSGLHYFIATVIFEIILILAVKHRSPALESAPLVWCGERSYSLYLLHVPIGLLMWAGCQRAGISTSVAVGASVPLSIGLSSWSRRHVEIPGQRLLKRAFGLAPRRAEQHGRAVDLYPTASRREAIPLTFLSPLDEASPPTS